MNSGAVPAVLALVFQLGLGIAVFQANPKRRSNQCFLILSLASSAWLASLGFGLRTNDPWVAEFCIRQASTAGVLYLAALNLLRLSICKRRSDWQGLLRLSRVWLICTIAIVALCQTRLFLQGVRMSSDASGPSPLYGSGIYAYAVYFIAAFLVLIISYVRDFKRAVGGERAELAFILIGGIAAVAVALLFAFTLDYLIGPEHAIWFAPFRMIIFTVVIAYGMVTRKIMDVGLLVRRIISYSLLAAYLLLLYVGVWWLVKTALQAEDPGNSREIAHVAAALAIAFAMAPARGISRRLAERLFISSHQLDFRATVGKAAEILSSVTTVQDLLQRFGGTIAEAVNAESILILLPERDVFASAYSFPHSQESVKACRLGFSEPMTEFLRTHREILVAEELHRVRATPEVTRLLNRMQELSIAAAIGIFSREHLAGIMLLGPRKSGRIYGSIEQDALQVLCGQLAIAIENAELFTEVQNAKIYNETLLQNLTTGVVAAGVDEQITVFNKEAGQITEIDASRILDQKLENLPDSIRDALRQTLRTGVGQENIELTLESHGEDVAVRASTSIFHGQDGQTLGALMVLTDVTALKRLELQIRRSDRLASLGTLSAGMAHEIKNPLVSIKTFAQLLPERYQDAEFRQTFSNLIGHEIDRIDSLVNQLLRFARPTKPHLQPMHVHEILEKSLLLVGHRLYQKDIKLTRSWEANVDTIRADSDQLEQVFLNFFINAMDAMKTGGELQVTTQIQADDGLIAPMTQSNGDAPEVLRVTIRDSGEGIRREDIPHVFDPFFTTKDYGTGLGLSVVHGIVQEHGGQIEVESELKKGTAFHILFPLVRFDSKVAAA